MDEAAPDHGDHHSDHRGDHPGPAHQQVRERDHRRAQQLAAALRATAATTTPVAADTADTAVAHDGTDLADRLCRTAVGELGARGATLCALFAPGMSVPVGISDPVAGRAEEVQFTAGEGPCWQAYETGEVVVADMSDPAGAERLDGLWPAYAPAVRRETGYVVVVAVPLTLTSGLPLVFTVYAASLHRDRWWLSASAVVGALREVLDTASRPAAQGGPAWLDSSSTVRRGAVWVAESLMIDADASLDPARALEALRTFSAVEGLTVDAAAAALVQGRLTAAEVLGRA